MIVTAQFPSGASKVLMLILHCSVSSSKNGQSPARNRSIIRWRSALLAASLTKAVFWSGPAAPTFRICGFVFLITFISYWKSYFESPRLSAAFCGTGRSCPS